MSDLDFSGLRDLSSKPSTAKRGWQPLTLDDLAVGKVLAFDQSLSATGWVMVNCAPYELKVVSAGKFGGGHQEILGQVLRDLTVGAKEIFTGCRNLIAGAKHSDYEFAHESPPNMAALKGKGSPVSSLMAAQALWCAAEAEGVEIHMYGAMPAKTLICGNPKATKIEAHTALRQQVLNWVVNSSEFITNEATRDALMIALLHLARRKV